MAPPAGLLNLCKPSGITSRKVVDQVLRLVRPAKAGHAGTLDPLASGVLVVCVGSATRLIECVQEQPKEYRATFRLGQTSDTDDCTGKVAEIPGVDPVPRAAVAELLPRFIGEIEQVPPQFSAVHVGGQRAYALAREGRAVPLEPRTVRIDSLTIVDYAYPRLEVLIACGSGTYVRALGRDIGAALQCGAVMTELIRTRIGPFRIEEAVILDDLDQETLSKHLLPGTAAVAHWPQHRCTGEDVRALRNGRRIFACPDWQAEQSRVALLTEGGTLAGLAHYDAASGMFQPTHVFQDALPPAG